MKVQPAASDYSDNRNDSGTGAGGNSLIGACRFDEEPCTERGSIGLTVTVTGNGLLGRAV